MDVVAEEEAEAVAVAEDGHHQRRRYTAAEFHKAESHLRHLSLGDFYEALVRIATLIALPTDEEIDEAGAQDAGDLLMGMQVLSPDILVIPLKPSICWRLLPTTPTAPYRPLPTLPSLLCASLFSSVPVHAARRAGHFCGIRGVAPPTGVACSRWGELGQGRDGGGAPASAPPDHFRGAYRGVQHVGAT